MWAKHLLQRVAFQTKFNNRYKQVIDYKWPYTELKLICTHRVDRIWVCLFKLEMLDEKSWILIMSVTFAVV